MRYFALFIYCYLLCMFLFGPLSFLRFEANFFLLFYGGTVEAMVAKPIPPRSSSMRSRAEEVHNLSEKVIGI